MEMTTAHMSLKNISDTERSSEHTYYNVKEAKTDGKTEQCGA